MNHALYLLSVPSSQLRAIKRAINVLVRVGMSREQAADIVILAHQERYHSHDSQLGVRRVR